MAEKHTEKMKASIENEPTPLEKKLLFVPSQYLKKFHQPGETPPLESVNLPQFSNNDFNILKNYFESSFLRLEKKFDNKVDNLESKLNTKVDNLESKLNTKVDNLESKLNTKVAYLQKNFSEFREDVNSLTEGILRHQISKNFSKAYAKPFILSKYSFIADYFINILTENSMRFMQKILKCDSLYHHLLETSSQMMLADKNLMKKVGTNANKEIKKMEAQIKSLILHGEPNFNQNQSDLSTLFLKAIEEEVINVKETDQIEINISGSLEMFEIQGNQLFVLYNVGEIKKRLSPYQFVKGLSQLLRICIIVSDILARFFQHQIKFLSRMTLYYVNMEEDFFAMMNQKKEFDFSLGENKTFELNLKKSML